MIKITLNATSDQVEKLTISGHANTNEYGKDLVCAGVSAIISGALNAFDKISQKSTKIVVEDNFVSVEIINQSIATKTMMDMLVWQLKTVKALEPKSIIIKNGGN